MNIQEDAGVCFLPLDNGTRKTHTLQHKYGWIIKPAQSESTCSLPNATHSRMWVTLESHPQDSVVKRYDQDSAFLSY